MKHYLIFIFDSFNESLYTIAFDCESVSSAYSYAIKYLEDNNFKFSRVESIYEKVF